MLTNAIGIMKVSMVMMICQELLLLPSLLLMLEVRDSVRLLNTANWNMRKNWNPSWLRKAWNSWTWTRRHSQTP